MDVGAVVGLVLGMAAVLVANVMEGGHLEQLLNPSASLLVLGGTLGATMASAGLQSVLQVPSAILYALRTPRLNPAQLTERLVAFAQKARQEGILALEEERSKLDDPILSKGLQFAIDGADLEKVREVMEIAIRAQQGRWLRAAGVLETAGGYAPTMGIIGTVLGLIHVLGNLSDVSMLGPAIAVAFMATFYGIATANLIWLPLASKIRANVQLEAESQRMVVEGVLSIQRGESPTLIREKLQAFVVGGAKGAAGEKSAETTADTAASGVEA